MENTEASVNAGRPQTGFDKMKTVAGKINRGINLIASSLISSKVLWHTLFLSNM